MKQSKWKWILMVTVVAAMVVLSACGKKKVAAPPPPPPPPAAAPTATLSANPTTIQAGQSTTLTWSTTDATDIRIEPLGPVDANGRQQVTPTESTNYHLIAKGAGGTADATARVTVSAAAPPPPPQQVSATLAQQFAEAMRDIYFDYDSYSVRPDAQSTLQSAAAFLKAHPQVGTTTIEGHCDERGSTEYNLALGDNRARAVRDALVQLGVPANSLNAISFGKEKPVCTESNEQCWQQNRRAHFAMGAASR